MAKKDRKPEGTERKFEAGIYLAPDLELVPRVQGKNGGRPPAAPNPAPPFVARKTAVDPEVILKLIAWLKEI